VRGRQHGDINRPRGRPENARRFETMQSNVVSIPWREKQSTGSAACPLLTPSVVGPAARLLAWAGNNSATPRLVLPQPVRKVENLRAHIVKGRECLTTFCCVMTSRHEVTRTMRKVDCEFPIAQIMPPRRRLRMPQGLRNIVWGSAPPFIRPLAT
jgi:hypothetical protein